MLQRTKNNFLFLPGNFRKSTIILHMLPLSLSIVLRVNPIWLKRVQVKWLSWKNYKNVRRLPTIFKAHLLILLSAPWPIHLTVYSFWASLFFTKSVGKPTFHVLLLFRNRILAQAGKYLHQFGFYCILAYHINSESMKLDQFYQYHSKLWRLSLDGI